MATIERAGENSILNLERLGHRARGKQLDLQAPATHLIDAVDEILRILMEDVLRRPRALELEHHGFLCAGHIGHRDCGGAHRCGGRSRLQEGAA